MGRKTTKNFIEESIQIHGHKYDYKNSIYINNKTCLKIKCPKHGEFEQIPAHHINGSVYIEIKKILESDKSEHSVKWFPVYYKRKAIRQFQKLNDTFEMLEVYVQTIVDFEEIKYGYKRINFNFSEKFNQKLSFEKKS